MLEDTWGSLGRGVHTRLACLATFNCLVGVPGRRWFTFYVACVCTHGPAEPQVGMLPAVRHDSRAMSKSGGL